MTCPRCYAEFPEDRGACPECGVRLLRSVSGMLKTSAVMISAAGERGFYRSVQDVPEPLRQELLRVTAGDNSGTIVIADRAGKEQLTQIVARRGSAQVPEGSSASEPAGKPAAGSYRDASFLGLSWMIWAGAALVLGSAGVIAAVFTIRF